MHLLGVDKKDVSYHNGTIFAKKNSDSECNKTKSL